MTEVENDSKVTQKVLDDLSDVIVEVPEGVYKCSIQSFKEWRKDGRNAWIVTFLVDEGVYASAPLKCFLSRDYMRGKKDLLSILRAVSKTGKAPEKFTDQMRRDIIGRQLYVGVRMRRNGKYVNSEPCAFAPDVQHCNAELDKAIAAQKAYEEHGNEQSAIQPSGAPQQQGSNFGNDDDVPF